jgi:hypothetical protein
MNPVVLYVPRCIQNGLERLGLKALKDFLDEILSKLVWSIFLLWFELRKKLFAIIEFYLDP